MIATMLLVLTGCQLAANAQNDTCVVTELYNRNTAAREMYNRYVARKGFEAKIHTWTTGDDAVSAVKVTAKNAKAWRTLQDEFGLNPEPKSEGGERVSSMSVSHTILDTCATDRSWVNAQIEKMLPGHEVTYDSLLAVTTTSHYVDGKLMEQQTDIQTDGQLLDVKENVRKDPMTLAAIKHGDQGFATLADYDHRAVTFLFYASERQLMALVVNILEEM